jgi:hypothetical protein
MAPKLKGLITATRGKHLEPAPVAPSPRQIRHTPSPAAHPARGFRASVKRTKPAPTPTPAPAPTDQPKRKRGRPPGQKNPPRAARPATTAVATRTTVQSLNRSDVRRGLSDPAARAVSEVFEQVPRNELTAALMRADLSGDRSLAKFAELLASPQHEDTDWAMLCQLSGATPRDVLRIIVESYTADGELVVARQLPRLLGGLAEAGIERIEDCAVCSEPPGPGKVNIVTIDDDGREVTLTAPCGMCVNGRVVVPADLTAAKLALEAVGVIGQRGPAVAVQVNNNGGRRGGRGGAEDTGAPDMSEWSRSTDAVYEERRNSVVEEAEQVATVDEWELEKEHREVTS